MAASVCMCMYLCVYMCMHSGMHAHTCAHAYVYVCVLYVYTLYVYGCIFACKYKIVYMYIYSLWLIRNWNCSAGSGRFGRCGLLHWNYIQHWILLNVIPMWRAVVVGASGICVMVLICMYCACICICIYLCVSMYIYMYRYVFVYHVRGRNCGKLRKKKFLSAPSVPTEISCLFIPPLPEGGGGILFYLCSFVRSSVLPYVRSSVRPIYVSSHFSQ